MVGSHATIVTQREQANESRLAEARVNRAKTYSGFLRATTAYSVADAYLNQEVDRAPGPDTPCRRGKKRTCGISNDVFGELVRTRNKFTDALNQVYIYGSAAGVRAARAVAATLPRSLNDEDGDPVYEPPINEGGTFSASNAFRNVMCREVSADPRPTC